jgi:hypothetical protein
MPAAAQGESALLARLDGAAPRIAAACLYLLSDSRWIRRRTELATFYEFQTCRLASTLDLVVPLDVIDDLELDRDDIALDRQDAEPLGQATSAHQPVANPSAEKSRRIVVPLDVLKKGRLEDFDLRMDGRSVSLLSSRETSRITAWMLTLIATQENEPLAPLDLLERVAGPGGTDSKDAYDELAGAYPRSPELCNQALKYRDNYVLLTEISLTGTHAIIKYARNEALSPRLKWEHRVGLAHPQLEVPLGSIAICGSYHVEAVVPTELKISYAVLQSGARDESGQWQGDLLDDVDKVCGRASLYVSKPPNEPAGRILVHVATSRSVLLAPAALIACLATLGMLAVGLLAVLGHLGDAVSGSSGSALFLAPSIAAGLVLYRPEAPLVRVMLGGARAALVMTSGAAFAAAAVLALGARGTRLGEMWLALALVGSVGATILAVAAFEAIPEVTRQLERQVPAR